MTILESLNVTFDETPPPSKTSPLVDDDLDEEEAIKVTEKKILENDIEDETLEIDKIVNIKESRNHPLENVIGNLNQRTLRAILGKTPYELLRDRKPTLDYFRVFGSKCFILNTKDYLTKFDPKPYKGVFLGYSQDSKAYIILNKCTRKIEESLNVTFNETPPPSKTSPLVDDDLDEEEAIKVTENKILENDIKDETLEINEIVNIKECRNHLLENVIGNINQRTLRNKLDENDIVSRNKARLVAQGYNQQKGIDYDRTYALVARLVSIRILLAYACALYFKLFQMDVKSAFLNGFINEEVYMAQPPGFIDFEKPDHVYKLKKALYGLKQAPKACYDRLKAFLIKHEYKIGMVDNTLSTKKKSSNLIIVQIYVDDIIFSSSCQDMCNKFAKIMHDEFETSMMDELNFFLGLQIKQIEDGIFFNQSKYIKEMLKKIGLEDSKPMKTPMSSDTKLTKDEECESIDTTNYRGMIGGHRDHVPACLCHMIYCIETSTNEWKGLEKNPKVILPYGMLLTRLFNHVVSNFPELAIDHYILYDRVMHPLAPYYERKKWSDHGTKRCRDSNPSSSSTALNHSSSSHHLDENDDESSHSSTPSLPQLISSLSTLNLEDAAALYGTANRRE
ncbi:retrovirus-related pol polyprotein from transposon TNT 1-94 [Tanacetum coccineum]